jgi:cytochrome c oxidase accessory protein FixG
MSAPRPQGEQLVQLRTALRPDGKHVALHPADVRGPWQVRRRLMFLVLIGVYVALPWIQIGGHPAIFLDIEARHFYLFGASFNAQDVWIMVFLLIGLLLALVVVTALLGRAWCGWACPQTVFIEGVYRRIERFIQGGAEARRRLDAGPWTGKKLLKKGATHAAYLVVSLLLANVALSYFVSLPRLFDMMATSPGKHPEAFAIMAGTAGLLYFDLGWFREQFCVVLCPYGRLQSVLIDRDSLVIGYDARRGEPRGKVSDPAAADCIDCRRCVSVCPTGIDIRNGMQMECLACTACIDACDEMMAKVERPAGLIRYASQRSLEGGKTRLFRPRLAFYLVILAIGGIAAGLALRVRPEIDALLVRLPGPPFTVTAEGQVENGFELQLGNKRSVPAQLTVTAVGPDGASVVVPVPTRQLASLEEARIPVFVRVPRGTPGEQVVRAEVRDQTGQVVARTQARLVVPPGVRRAGATTP